MSASQCPACRAAVPTGAPWCLLCHLDLRPAPEPVSVPAQPAPAGCGPRHGTAAPGWPCVVCGADNDLEAPVCTGCGAGFLAGLGQSAEASLRLPGLGEVSRLSRSVRLALAAGVGLVAALLLTGVVLLVGTLL